MSEFEQPIVDDRNPHTLAQFLPIIAVLLLAAWLRIINGAAFPVSTDEGWTTWAIAEPTYRTIVDILAADRHPPLYFLGLGYWSRLAGESRLALRAPSMLMGVLTVAMIYRIGADTFGRTARAGREDVSWYGMLMFALLPVAVYYTQEIRHYGAFMAAVVWSCLLFIRILRTPRVHLLLLYSLSVAIMLYLLYFAVWVILLHVITGLLLWRGDAQREWQVSWKDRSKLLAAWVGALLLYTPWIVVIFTEQWAILTAGITAAPGSFTSALPDLLRLLQLLMGGGLALTFGLYVIGFWGSLVSDRTDVTLGLRLANPAWLGELFIVLWGLGLFVLLAMVNTQTGVLSARTMVFISPALMLVVGAGIVRLRVGVRWSLLAGFVMVSIVTPPVIQPRLDYPVAAAALAQRAQPDDLIVLETGWDDNAFRYEIRRQVDTTQIIRTLPWVNNRDGNVPVVPQIADDLQRHQRVWVVQWLQPSQVIPYLTDNGYTRTATYYTDVGEQYRGAFAAFGATDTVQVVRLARPADTAPMVFDEVFTLTGAVYDQRVSIGDDLVIDLWWTVDQTPPLDYSVGLFLTDNANTPAASLNLSLNSIQSPAYDYDMADGVRIRAADYYERPTSQWGPGDRTYTGYSLPLPPDLPPGDYTLTMAVYHFQTPDAPISVGGQPRYTLGSVTVVAD